MFQKTIGLYLLAILFMFFVGWPLVSLFTDRPERKKIPRWLAVWITVTTILCAAIMFFTFIIPLYWSIMRW
jgi:predicted PurR-regulated permease PerM